MPGVIVGTTLPLEAFLTVLPPGLDARLHAGTSIADAVDVVDVADVTHDSRQVRPGWAFVCIVGDHADGHAFAPAAVAHGATLLVVERPLLLDVPQLIVSDCRKALGPLAALVHGRPATKLRTIGITGTNGKTTTAHMLAAILRSAALETRVQGTLSGARTTPEASDLQRLLAEYVTDGVDAVVMEVSSHALALQRVGGMHFAVGVFTNLGRDHLDLHESMEAYFRAKASLFTPELIDAGVTNVDDPHGRLLLDAADVPVTGFSRSDAADVVVGIDRIGFTWRGRRIDVPLGGDFNVMNALGALTAAEVLGVELEVAAAGLAKCPPVPGRFETVSDPDLDAFSVVVDYAHTPDGLTEVLSTARAVAQGGRVIVVFGCGGDRDADKRPLMAAAAAAGGDLIVLTSDNPRHEDPMAIIDAAAAGIGRVDRRRFTIEPDRRAAIAAAIALAGAGDIVVVAGKGHETTQTIGDVAHPFDDRLVARRLLTENRGRS